MTETSRARQCQGPHPTVDGERCAELLKPGQRMYHSGACKRRARSVRRSDPEKRSLNRAHVGTYRLREKAAKELSSAFKRNPPSIFRRLGFGVIMTAIRECYQTGSGANFVRVMLDLRSATRMCRSFESSGHTFHEVEGFDAQEEVENLIGWFDAIASTRSPSKQLELAKNCFGPMVEEMNGEQLVVYWNYVTSKVDQKTLSRLVKSAWRSGLKIVDGTPSILRERYGPAGRKEIRAPLNDADLEDLIEGVAHASTEDGDGTKRKGEKKQVFDFLLGLIKLIRAEERPFVTEDKGGGVDGEL